LRQVLLTTIFAPVSATMRFSRATASRSTCLYSWKQPHIVSRLGLAGSVVSRLGLAGSACPSP
jgi:hypothetical protein